MSLTVESLFTLGGVPKTGLSPTVEIWEIVGLTKTPVIGPISMTDVGDGYYLYDFTTGSGFDPTKSYTTLSDGELSLPPNERWQTSQFNPIVITLSPTDIVNITDAVWDEPKSAHLIGGSTGEALNMIKSDTAQLRLDALQIIALITEVLKYDKNRTKLDSVNKQLIVYDDDNSTILRKFQLKDSAGGPSLTEVFERLPI